MARKRLPQRRRGLQEKGTKSCRAWPFLRFFPSSAKSGLPPAPVALASSQWEDRGKSANSASIPSARSRCHGPLRSLEDFHWSGTQTQPTTRWFTNCMKTARKRLPQRRRGAEVFRKKATHSAGAWPIFRFFPSSAPLRLCVRFHVCSRFILCQIWSSTCDTTGNTSFDAI